MATHRPSHEKGQSKAHTKTQKANHAPKSRHTFVRHVAPLAPVALALAMNTVPSAKQAPADTTAGKGHPFVLACTMPFKSQANTAIDGRCPMSGGSSDPAKQAESRSKNNFCAETATPQDVTYKDLIDLQATAAAAKLKKSMPDRSEVEKMGEGKYVSYVAYVKEAHYSDVNAGEAVNCNIPGNDTNDIHIVLVQESDLVNGKPDDTDECKSTTAEMSPHYRPAGWTPDALMKAAAGHPIRVRGHLFYDGSHSPCTEHSRPNPKRASLWEVHPVYSFEICSGKSVAECQAAGAEWTPLEKINASEGQE